MRRLLLVACSLAFAASLFAASITSITPGLGTTNGGDTVTIVVDTPLYSCPVCSPPVFEAEVTFDGIAARSVSAWVNTITAVTPAHGPGVVQVAVSSHGTPYGTTTFTYHGFGSGQIDSRNYEKVLVPIALSSTLPLPGAFGSQWRGEFWASNPTPYPVEFFNDVFCTSVCPTLLPGEGPYPALPAATVTPILTFATTNYGFVYYLQKTYANDISFSLHIADVSRDNENAGAEIGVVRERDFRGSAFDILNVPVDALSRAKLRIYDPNAYANQSADVEIYSMTGNTLLATASVPLTPAAAPINDPARRFPPYAGFAQLSDLRSAFGTPLPSGRVRVHISFHTGVNQSWGFVSVTNNATQLVTTYRPE
jgi:hypothetical protein